ncbi:MAG: ATP-binding protein [Vampirovibrionales bacterium]|nr:ATP-binding protein [Vampirovibrionales bacterium]
MMSYLTQKPKLPIGTPIPGHPAIEKALHSDKSCEVYLLEECSDSSLLFIIVSEREEQEIIRWWEENKIEYFPVEKIQFISQKAPNSFQAVVKVSGKWLGGYSPELDRKGLVNLLLALVKLAKASESFEASPRYAPSLLWLSVNKEMPLSGLILTSIALKEVELIQLIGKTFYTLTTGIDLNESQDIGLFAPLSKWCVNAGPGLSGLINRCIDQAVPSLLDIENEAISFTEEETMALPNLPRATSTRRKSPQVQTKKPLEGGLAKVAGMRELKDLLVQEVIKPINDPEPYKKYGLSIPNGILLFGPPGCGKTYIAKQLAEELGLYFVQIIPSEIASPYINQSILHIRDIFETAKERAPSILFIDEFEAMVPSRSELGGHQQHKAGEVNEFLSQLNECAAKNIFVIAATNEPEKIDSAIRRTGRLDKLIYVGPPDEEAREEMLKLHLKNRPTDETIDLAGLSKQLIGYSASDIRFLVDEAARLAMRTENPVSSEIMFQVMAKIPASITDEITTRYKSFTSRGI